MRQERAEALPEERAAAPSLVGFLACHCLAGVIAGWAVVGGLLWLNVAGLGRLVMASDLFPVPLLMLLAAFAITFGSVAMGSAIIGLGRSGGPPGVTGRRSLRPALSGALGSSGPGLIRAVRRRP